ncbi:hypothetical protein HOY80DRAFT_1039955 [Tuber brumale]|nr:hypothetical protein HOY80DRAFT_1039955 [Tuber brumale]
MPNTKLIFADVDYYKMAQVINQTWIKAEDLPIGPVGARGVQRIQKAITSRTGRRWLSKLGYKWKEVRKEVYKDGHERDDVIAYYNEVFLPSLRALNSRLMVWDAMLEPEPTQQVLNKEE